MEFEHYGDGVCVAGHVNEVLELIYVCIYIVPAFEIDRILVIGVQVIRLLRLQNSLNIKVV
jgi:hypothetical protein